MSAITQSNNNFPRVCDKISNSTDHLNKTVKVLGSVLKIAQSSLFFVPGSEAIRGGLSSLSKTFKQANDTISATATVGRVADLADDKTRAKIGSTFNQRMKFSTLAVANTLSTISFIDTGLNIKFLTQAALTLGGVLPVVDLVKNVLFLTSGGYGIWKSAQDLTEASTSLKEAQVKVKKWEQLKIEFSHDLNDDIVGKALAKYQSKLAAENAKSEDKDLDKVTAYTSYVGALTDESKELRERVRDFQALKSSRMLEKYNLKILNFAESEKEIPALESSITEKKELLKTETDKVKTKALKYQVKNEETTLTALKAESVKVKALSTYAKALEQGKASKLANHQVEKFSVRASNCERSERKSWISIVAEISKCAMIIIGMVVAALAITCSFLTLPQTAVALAILGLLSNGFGLAKSLYSDIWFKQDKEPEFILA